MTNKKIILALTLILTGYFSYNFLFKSNDEKLILTVIDQLQEQVEFDSPLKKTEVFSRVQIIKKYINDEIKIEAFEGERILIDSNSFDDIQSGAFIGSKYLAKHKTYITETNVDINKLSATVDLVLVSEGSEQGQANNFRELFSVELSLIKIDDQWVVSKVIAERQTD